MADGQGGGPPLLRLAQLSWPLAVAGGLLLLGVAGLVVVSVLMRWLLGTSVPGDIELVQIATALSVFSFLPICQAHRGNIMVDTFTTWLPRSVQRAIDALWDFVYAFVMAVIAWRLAIGAFDTFKSNTVSMMLGLPIGWAIGACAVMAAFLVAVAVSTGWVMLRSRA